MKRNFPFCLLAKYIPTMQKNKSVQYLIENPLILSEIRNALLIGVDVLLTVIPGKILIEMWAANVQF